MSKTYARLTREWKENDLDENARINALEESLCRAEEEVARLKVLDTLAKELAEDAVKALASSITVNVARTAGKLKGIRDAEGDEARAGAQASIDALKGLLRMAREENDRLRIILAGYKDVERLLAEHTARCVQAMVSGKADTVEKELDCEP